MSRGISSAIMDNPIGQKNMGVRILRSHDFILTVMSHECQCVSYNSYDSHNKENIQVPPFVREMLRWNEIS